MIKDEALKLALEALEEFGEHHDVCPRYPTYAEPENYPPCNCGFEKAITAIREALAQPEHSCVACEGNPKGNNNPCAVCGLAQPEQEPVAWINWCAATGKRSVSFECESELASQPLYAGITQNTQDHYSKFHSWFDSELHRKKYTQDHPAYLAAQEAWNAANDAAQYRINRLNAEIEACKVRFKIAEDALAKLNGPEQKPVATLWQHGGTGRTRITMPGDITDCDARWFKVSDLYTSPQRKPWVGLTDEDVYPLANAHLRHQPESYEVSGIYGLVSAIEAKLKEKNT